MQVAARRIGQMALAKGFSAWLAQWEERQWHKLQLRKSRKKPKPWAIG